MDFGIEDYRKESGYRKSAKAFREVKADIQACFGENVKVGGFFGRGGFHITVHPTVPLDMHSFISFVSKVYEHVNVAVSKGVNSMDDAVGTVKTLQRMGLGGQLAQQLGAMLSVPIGRCEGYKIRHMDILNNKGETIETFKKGTDDKLILAPCIPKNFDWASAWVRIPKD